MSAGYKGQVTCGIDSSTMKTGIAWFCDGKYDNHVLIDESKTKDADQRFEKMCKGIYTMLDHIRPDVVCIERMHTVRNPDTFRKLCKVMGAIQWQCLDIGAKYIELSPAEWRKFAKANPTDKIGRKREELKAWSIARVKELTGLDVSDDEADAILIAYGYSNKDRKENK